jgi:ubiquinone/menaquinone biosynthesis C-methylase UbiE
MSAVQPQAFAAPFDAVADRYDDVFTESKIGRAQRDSVWKELARAFCAGDRVLEIGCGTGVDACFLAERGVRVVACDSSARMIERTKQRMAARGLQHQVHPYWLTAENIPSLPRNEYFDGVFSNFGVLNCIEDLGSLARDLASLLRPGAPALLCLMGRFCLWEVSWYLAQRNLDKAFRRMHRQAITARIADGAELQVYYPSVRSMVRIFAPEFHLRSVKAIGLAVPPSYLEFWVQRRPRFFEICERVDSCLARCPGFRILGDHVLLQFERKKATDHER